MLIRTAATMQGATGWLMAVELDDSPPRGEEPDTVLTRGRYEAALNHIDCEGCAAAVETAVQRIRGIVMAGVKSPASTLVFEVESGARVHLSDIRETLGAVSDMLGTSISLSGLRGPLPVMYSAA